MLHNLCFLYIFLHRNVRKHGRLGIEKQKTSQSNTKIEFANDFYHYMAWQTSILLMQEWSINYSCIFSRQLDTMLVCAFVFLSYFVRLLQRPIRKIFRLMFASTVKKSVLSSKTFILNFFSKCRFFFKLCYCEIITKATNCK